MTQPSQNIKMRIFFFLFAFISFAIPSTGQTLVWSDEFDGDALNTSYWNYDLGNGASGWGNNELEYYTSRPENIKVENGKLIITARNESYSGYNYTSARIHTKNKAYWKYGRIEMKAKLPKGKGTWPAFWMLPQQQLYGSNYWPDNGEIDIMEYVGYQPGFIYGSVHTHQNYGGNSVTGHIEYSGVEDDFHVYAIEWTEDNIKYYVDSYYYTHYYRPVDQWNYWPFNQNFFILLNFAVGGNWGGAQGVDNTIFPQTYEIDYVRVYSLATDAETTDLDKLNISVFPNPTDRFINISMKNNLDKDYLVTVYDLLGRIVVTPEIYREDDAQIDLQNLNAGIYILKVNQNNSTKTFKIIKG